MNKVIARYGKAALLASTAAGFLVLPIATHAGEITLKSADGTVNLVGEYVDFRDDSYIIRTVLGDLRVAASRVRCEGADCPTFETAAANVRIAGSDTVGEGVMPLLMSGYAGFLNAEASITNTQVEGQLLASLVGDGGFGDDIGTFLVTSTSTGDAFDSLLNNEASVGMASRRILPREARTLRDAGLGTMVSPSQEFIIAADSLVVIVNPENKLSSITVEDLARVFSGEYTNWNQLGGEDAPITVISAADDLGSDSVFNARVFGGETPPRPDGLVEAADTSAAAAMVNDDPTAISVVGYAFQRGAKPLSLVNECGISSEADSFAAKTEEYSLQRRLYLYTTDKADQMTRDFLAFTQSEAADGVIAKAGFIDLGIERRAQSMEGERAISLLNTQVDAFEGNVIREFLAQMVQSDRLSTTFRFRLGSSSLDERARLDMERLTNYLQGMPEGTKVTMVGFTDDVGAFESNRKLSEQRARSVVDELRAWAGDRLTGIEFAAAGFGEIAPSACNSTEYGRGINRRVEVWIDKNAEG